MMMAVYVCAAEARARPSIGSPQQQQPECAALKLFSAKSPKSSVNTHLDESPYFIILYTM